MDLSTISELGVLVKKIDEVTRSLEELTRRVDLIISEIQALTGSGERITQPCPTPIIYPDPWFTKPQVPAPESVLTSPTPIYHRLLV